MPSENLSDRPQKSSANPKAKSSLVHKPFATGTINIFNPHRSKKDNKNKSNPPKLSLNAELERDLDEQKAELELSELDVKRDEIEYCDRTWIDSLFSPWGISAIAILLLVNLISAGFIWRTSRNTVKPSEVQPPVAKIGNNNFSDKEFIPLNLSTLGTIKTTKNEETPNKPVAPIAPALAPLDNIASISVNNTPFHYILTEYTGEQSLSLAQQKVAQVSLVNFPQGILIYMGAFKNREDANNFAAQLKREDFPITVFPLD